jgi:transcriptional regulator with XRE-family HTH domain
MLCNHDATMLFPMPWRLFRINLRALRRDRSLTQSAVAEAIGVDRVTYARWESGQRRPSVDAIANLAAFYGTSIDALLGISKPKAKVRKR